MLLLHKNCKIEITDEKIECEYLYLMNKTIHWEISLKETLKFKEIILIPEEVIEFQFEIDDRSQKGYNIPFSFKYYIETKKKRKGLEYLLMILIIGWLLLILMKKLS